MGSDFERFDAADVRALITEYPLAWVIANGSADASLLPLLGEYDEQGQLVSLFGHMARRNPLHAHFVMAPEALILFNGPQGYVSPEQAGRRNWGPTWNYAQLRITATIELLPQETDHALAALTEAMEGDRWTPAELGARYRGMADAVIAFRARVSTLSGIFKLGQDESPEVYASIHRTHPDAALRRWMERFTPLLGA